MEERDHPVCGRSIEKIQKNLANTLFKLTSKQGQTLRQKLVHPKDKTPGHELSNVYVIQCNEKCFDLHIGESKQPLHMHGTTRESRLIRTGRSCTSAS